MQSVCDMLFAIVHCLISIHGVIQKFSMRFLNILVSAAVVGGALDDVGAEFCLPYIGATYRDGVVYLRIFSPGRSSCAVCFIYDGMSFTRVGCGWL